MSCYLYAVAGPLPGPCLEGLRGVADEAVEAVEHGGLTAVVGEVPAEEFSERALRARLENLQRLEALARAHHHVVDAVAAHTAVLPLRLAVVYRDAERVREVLREREAGFRSALARLEGRAEWGVKVYAAPRSPVPAPAAAPEAADSGRSYLRQRLRQRQDRDDGLRRATELGHRADMALRALADDVRLHRPQDPRLSGADGENVLNAAYLVAHDRREAFAARVRELAEQEPSARMELTGPWAPYSFTLPDDGSGGDEQGGSERRGAAR